jgi:hypothetical protein
MPRRSVIASASMSIENGTGKTRSPSGAALALLLALALVGGAPAGAATGLTPAIEKALGDSEYVYVSSTRKDGSLSEKAEIWFMYEGGKVYVGTPPTSWRVKRIEWGRPAAKIWVGSREGPSFDATGAIVKDPKLYERLYEVFAKKYPEGWKRHEDGFRKGFQDGSRVLVAYTPKA